MSDIEEVVIPKSCKKKDTKPEIARLKMKEKRERLKKEKEDAMINEAKNRLAQELEKKKIEDEKKKHEEEEKLKQDPIYQIRMMLEQLTKKEEIKPTKKTKKKEVEEEPVYVEEEQIPKKRGKKKVEEVVKAPKPTVPKTPKPKAPRKKKLPVEESPSNVFVGQAPEPEPREIEYVPTNPLLERLALRRRMGSYY
jgi:hypothetical protein